MASIPGNVVLFGGGTGSFTLLQSLKEYTTELAAIINMCDDGGSTGILRDELGVLPPGDVRQCLVALSDNPEVRNLFNYRFSEGRLSGQSLGNIILSGLELQYESFAKAIEVAGRLLHITGTVIPATLDNHQLVLRDGDVTVHGETAVAEYAFNNRKAVIELLPQARINPAARTAIAQADVIVIAPGNIYRSILPVLAVSGVAEALSHSDAKVVYVANLVNRPEHTQGWHVVDYVEQIERYIGKGRVDLVLYNTAPIAPALLDKYADEGELPVLTDSDRFHEVNAAAIGDQLVAAEITKQDPADILLHRTLIRHDAQRVYELIARYCR
ncbi:MAG TPA: gluconeogenesis factor YvcK family protein [Candidatus Saccharimonadales bacterium]|nr:gluconeogenesis factor YvcK family protein [Candidatus Saccharimonadales bacterium]